MASYKLCFAELCIIYQIRLTYRTMFTNDYILYFSCKHRKMQKNGTDFF